MYREFTVIILTNGLSKQYFKQDNFLIITTGNMKTQMEEDYNRIDVHVQSEWEKFIFSVVDMAERPDSTDCYFTCEYLDPICDTFKYSLVI